MNPTHRAWRSGAFASVILVMAPLIGPAASYGGGLVYLQDWESGVGGWFSKHGPGDPVVLVKDPLAPSPVTVQQVTRVDSGGNYFSPLIPAQGGKTYCVASWIRWIGGGWPFVGIDNYDAGDQYIGENWLIGREGYPDGGGDTVTPVSDDTLDWEFYQKTIRLPAATVSLRLKDELWFEEGKGGDNLGFFDDLRIVTGECACFAAIRVARLPYAPGDTAPVNVYIAHRRDEIVTIAWEVSLIDAAGRVLARRMAPLHTFEPGDVVSTKLRLNLPDDLATGRYALRLAVSGMDGVRGATTFIEVVESQ